MRRKKYPFLIAFIVVIGSLAYLLLNTFESSLQYYVTVSELRAEESDYKDRILKVAGIAKNIVRQDLEEGGSLYNFDVEEGGDFISVSYRGLAPDTFKENSEVVVTGSLDSNGSFEGSHILAKCASKYEAKVDAEFKDDDSDY